MKCPKCGYLGFETGDRCRNCGYDFSLAPAPSDGDLTLNQPHAAGNPLPDFELPTSSRSGDRAAALDLDRLFGLEPEQPPSSGLVLSPLPSAADSIRPDHEPSEPEPALMAMTGATTQGSSELPFDEGAIVRPPRPARPPLGVRRTTPDLPRTRPRSNRPNRLESSADLPVEASTPDAEASSATPDVAAVTEAGPSMEPVSLPVRLGAFAIDAVLLGAVSLGVLVLTLRIADLRLTWDDVGVLPPIPFVAFLALLSLGYAASFTVAGGQTIGKMLTGARVIGDDGRPVDVAGAVLRALGCALVPLTLGLSYAPVIMSRDHRALHDRLAGTRVVRA
jgi:uncharacterized RDD family membrane protein YckC